MLKLVEGADVELQAAARAYRELADAVARSDASVASAKMRIARARARLSVEAEQVLERARRDAQSARGRLVAVVGGAATVKRRLMQASVVVLSVGAIATLVTAIVGVATGLGAVPALGALDAFTALLPANLFWTWLNSWPNC